MEKAHQEISDNGRVVLYPSGIVTFQPTGQGHGTYKSNLPKGFAAMSQQQMESYTRDLFKRS